MNAVDPTTCTDTVAYNLGGGGYTDLPEAHSGTPL